MQETNCCISKQCKRQIAALARRDKLVHYQEDTNCCISKKRQIAALARRDKLLH
eukprot:jgi/Antlo1/458/1661